MLVPIDGMYFNDMQVLVVGVLARRRGFLECLMRSRLHALDVVFRVLRFVRRLRHNVIKRVRIAIGRLDIALAREEVSDVVIRSRGLCVFVMLNNQSRFLNAFCVCFHVFLC